MIRHTDITRKRDTDGCDMRVSFAWAQAATVRPTATPQQTTAFIPTRAARDRLHLVQAAFGNNCIAFISSWPIHMQANFMFVPRPASTPVSNKHGELAARSRNRLVERVGVRAGNAEDVRTFAAKLIILGSRPA